MKIVKLKGGLGNQMFQYTFGILLNELTSESVALDYSSFQAVKGDAIRVPRLEKFHIGLVQATNEQIAKICWLNHNSNHGNKPTLSYKLSLAFESTFNRRYFREPNRAYIQPETIMKKAYFDGYWQSWRYVDKVKDRIRKDFVPNYQLSEKTRRTQQVLANENAVFVGVRRGDFLEEADHYGSFGSDYYRRAMSLIKDRVKAPVFYVFSNDIPWCKQNIDWKGFDVQFREPEMQTDDFEELMLMASCKHAIIVNSTYNWWGAYLISNPEKIICCPNKWFFDNKPIDIIPDEWERIATT